MPTDTLYRQLKERPENENLWEGRRAEGLTLDNLDIREVVRIAEEGISAQRVPADIGNDPETILRGFKLLTQDGHITNAAAVLFSKKTQLVEGLFQCTLKLARFKGTDKTEFLDQNFVHGGAFHLLSEAEFFIRRHQPVAAKVVPEHLEIQQTPLLPRDAVRETLINALIHRDYSDPGGSLNVAIYDDRMEVRNAGLLPAGIRLDQLKAEHESFPRNQRIANVFYLSGMIETWGRGTLKIVDLCKAAGREEPEFVEEQKTFGVVFRAPFSSSAQLLDIESSFAVVNEVQKRILDVLDASKKTPTRVIVSKTGIAKRSVIRAVKELIELGFIESMEQGSARGYRKKRPE